MLQTQTISNIRNKCLAVVLNRHSFLSRNASRYTVHKALVTLFRNRAEIDSYRAHMSNPQSRVLETTHTLEHIFFYCFSMLGFVYDTCSRDSLKGWGRAACASSLALRSMSRVLGLSQPDMLFLPCVFIVSSNVTQGSLHLSVVKCHAEISTLECNKT